MKEITGIWGIHFVSKELSQEILQTFWVGIGKAAQEKYGFQCGVTAQGKAQPVQDPRIESVEYYKVSGISVSGLAEEVQIDGPPWHGIPQKSRNLPVTRPPQTFSENI